MFLNNWKVNFFAGQTLSIYKMQAKILMESSYSIVFQRKRSQRFAKIKNQRNPNKHIQFSLIIRILLGILSVLFNFSIYFEEITSLDFQSKCLFQFFSVFFLQ